MYKRYLSHKNIGYPFSDFFLPSLFSKKLTWIGTNVLLFREIDLEG